MRRYYFVLVMLAMLLLLAAAGISIALPRAEALGMVPEGDAPGFSLGFQDARGTVVSEKSYTQGIVCDQTWTTTGSPYNLTSSVLVPSGCYLVISPGVEVRFVDGLAMQVDGTLIARGTASQPITFTSSRASPSPGSWGFVKFTDTSVDATFDGAGNYTGGSILQYAVVEYAGSTGNGAIWLDNAAPFIDNCTIRYNNRSGIRANNSSGLRITGNTIANNIATGSGGGINASYSTATISGNTIANNTITSSGSGIFVTTSTVTISGNTIANNTTASHGGGIYTYYGTVVTISSNTIANNSASGNGGGIRILSGTATISGNTIANNAASGDGGGINALGTATILGNTIAGNTAASRGGGIYARDTVTITHNKVVGSSAPNYAGIYGGAIVTGNSIVANNVPAGSGDRYGIVRFAGTTFSCNTVVSNTAPIARGGVSVSGNPTTFSYNNLYGNTSYQVYNLNSYGSPMVNATNNWWGTTDSDAIEAEIYDFFDDASRGIVNYTPYLTANETCAPPSPPTGLRAISGTNQIALSWLVNPEADIAGYKVYYDTDSGFPYANAITVGNVLSYTVGPLTAGTRYYLAVTAYDSGGDESWYSEEASAIPITGVVTPTPTPTATPTETPTPTPTPTPVVSVSVSASQPWTDTGVDLTPGARVDIAAGGIIYIAGSDPGKTPMGASCEPLPGFVAPGLPCWSLIGRIASGPAFFVGINYNSIVTSTGRLYLGVNDDIFGDNRGAWWATVQVTLASTGTVAGRADLQGRSDDSGAVITLTGSTYTATTAADGAFTITDVAAGTYTATVSMPGYLYAMRTGVAVADGVTTMLPTVTLLGGDADRDGDIDIYDLTLLGASFGLAAPPADIRADITGDGAVNIFDLVLVGANYGLAAPRPWP